jgi:hypothetical protein
MAGKRYADMTLSERIADARAREDARLDAVRFQILYSDRTPTVNFSLRDGKAKARRFYLKEKRAGKAVSWWDTHDNQLSRDFFSIGGR